MMGPKPQFLFQKIKQEKSSSSDIILVAQTNCKFTLIINGNGIFSQSGRLTFQKFLLEHAPRPP